MNYLIDTHILLWYIDEKDRLSEKIISEIENPNNTVFISRATFFEIAIKINIGKLTFSIPYLKVEELIIQNGFNLIEIEFSHLHQYTILPFNSNHRDPFDRILIAQAQCENLTIITHDTIFKKYDVKVHI